MCGTCVGRDSCVCSTWLTHTCDSLIHVTLIHVTRHRRVWHDSYMFEAWRIYMHESSNADVWHDSFICETWRTDLRDMTYWRVILRNANGWPPLSSFSLLSIQFSALSSFSCTHFLLPAAVVYSFFQPSLPFSIDSFICVTWLMLVWYASDWPAACVPVYLSMGCLWLVGSLKS